LQKSEGRCRVAWWQMVWGVLLVAAGVGVFYRVPRVLPQLPQMNHALGYALLYLMGVLLIGGGIRKIYREYRKGFLTGRDPH